TPPSRPQASATFGARWASRPAIAAGTVRRTIVGDAAWPETAIGLPGGRWQHPTPRRMTRRSRAGGLRAPVTTQAAPTYGGQALVEGVLIRSGQRWAVALRTPRGDIHTYDGELGPPRGAWQLPFLRGLHALGVQLRLGMRALSDSSMLADTGEIRPISVLTTAA